MIKNERQYRITKAQAQKFESALASIQKKSVEDNKIHPILQKLESKALRSQLEELKTQLSEYEELQSGEVTIPRIRSLEELPLTLIKARIASGLTQKKLAQRLGLKEQQIQRYEANDYRTASFARLLEISEALDMEIQEFKEEKDELEKDILQSVDRLVEGFRNRTGFSPHDIKIYLADVSGRGENPRRWVVSEAEVNIDL